MLILVFVRLLHNFRNVTTGWCFIFITLVLEWFCVIVIPLFPFIFYAYTNSLGFCWCWSYALKNNVFHSAFPLHQTIFFLSTVTWKFLTFIWLKCVLIVAAYYLRNTFVANITYLTIEYFMQLVIFWKMAAEIDKHSGNLQCDLGIFIRQHHIKLRLIFFMKHFFEITTSNFLICLKITLKNLDFWIRWFLHR